MTRNYFWKKMLVIEMWFVLLLITDLIFAYSIDGFKKPGMILAYALAAVSIAYALVQFFHASTSHRNEVIGKKLERR